MTRVGIDVGGTKVALRADDDGRVAESTFRWDATGGVRHDLDLLNAHVRSLLPRSPVTAVGVAVPALCDQAGVVRTWPGRPSWVGVDLTAALRGLFPTTPVAHADDGDLAAMAEARAARCQDVLYLGVGTGVGGGMVLDDRSWPARGSCEVGHVVVDRAGPACDCGRRGCVQAVGSGPATLRRAATLRGRDVAYADLVEGTRTGEEWAMAALRESAHALATAVVGIGELAHPALTLIGGGFAAGLPDLVPLVAADVEALTRPGVDPVPVRPALLGGLSSLHGAMLLAEMIEEHRGQEILRR